MDIFYQNKTKILPITCSVPGTMALLCCWDWYWINCCCWCWCWANCCCWCWWCCCKAACWCCCCCCWAVNSCLDRSARGDLASLLLNFRVFYKNKDKYSLQIIFLKAPCPNFYMFIAKGQFFNLPDYINFNIFNCPKAILHVLGFGQVGYFEVCKYFIPW